MAALPAGHRKMPTARSKTRPDGQKNSHPDPLRRPLPKPSGVYGNTAARKQGQNIWTDERSTNDPNPSYMSYGLGFYEYFLLAEDLNALSPLSVTVLRIHRQ